MMIQGNTIVQFKDLHITIITRKNILLNLSLVDIDTEDTFVQMKCIEVISAVQVTITEILTVNRNIDIQNLTITTTIFMKTDI